MKLFACDNCRQVLFFESVRCPHCSRAVAYLPELRVLSTFDDRVGPPRSSTPDRLPAWAARTPEAKGESYRVCRNYVGRAVCNWAVRADDANEYCQSCRLDHTIPALSDPEARTAWHRLEIAKRRLLYTLMELKLPIESKTQSPTRGLAFDFLKDAPDGTAPKVFTGHHAGLITINIAEADNPFRAKMQEDLGETYRTVLGHFRHEIGHHYWDRLVKDSGHLDGFRRRFGDERASYKEAMVRHYDGGPPANWAERFVSAYASMHPWEDWAETWAHYLHIVDTSDTAQAYRITPRVPGLRSPADGALGTGDLDPDSFDTLMAEWVPLTMALNSLNRSVGMNDAYPFVLSAPAVAKLRFVHQLIQGVARANGPHGLKGDGGDA